MTSQPEIDAARLTELIESLPVPWPPGMTFIVIDFFPAVQPDGTIRLELAGVLPADRRRRIALLAHLADACTRALADEIAER